MPRDIIAERRRAARRTLTRTPRMRRPEPEPETRVGNCCGCGMDPITLFKCQGIPRYRCAECFEKENHYRHHLSPHKVVP